jgi:mono/diheme cytochrome c family protein
MKIYKFQNTLKEGYRVPGKLWYLVFSILLCSSSVIAEEANPKHLFQIHCQTCHGPEGRGDGPLAQGLNPAPRDLTVRPYKQGCGPGAIVHTLQNGVPGSAMPTFSEILTEDELWSLSRYVRSLQGGSCRN